MSLVHVLRFQVLMFAEFRNTFFESQPLGFQSQQQPSHPQYPQSSYSIVPAFGKPAALPSTQAPSTTPAKPSAFSSSPMHYK